MLFVLVFLHSALVQAGEKPQHPIPVTLTVSGGGSLGSYQAGYLYYLLEITKLNPDVWDIRAMTGTSAGSINTALALFSLCDELEPDPLESIFYQTWSPMGIDALYKADQVGAVGILSRDAFRDAVQPMRERFAAGWSTGCGTVWGTALTRLQPREVHLADDFAVPQSLEHVIIDFRGRGPGQPVQVTPRLSPETGYSRVVLPLSDPGVEPFALFEEAVYASAAVPLVFQPVSLPVCLIRPNEDPSDCAIEDASNVQFIDGGLFDNAPVRLANQLATQGEAELMFRFHLDAYLGRYPQPTAPPLQSDASAMVLLGSMMSGLVNVTSTNHLTALMDEDPQATDLLVLGRAAAPPMSIELSSFFGMFETSFRRFDFYLGMVSAHMDMLKRSQRFNELRHPEDQPTAPADSWAPFLCMQAMLGEDPSVANACEAPSMRDLRPLLQVSIERLYALCDVSNDAQLYPTCLPALAGVAPPSVPGHTAPVGDGWRMRAEESTLEHLIRRLSYHGFLFVDSDANDISVRAAMKALRREMSEPLRELARQNPEQRVMLNALTRSLVRRTFPRPSRQDRLAEEAHPDSNRVSSVGQDAKE
ncbi:MAG: patatin-like phospholipase family protein [Myxococcota bacterium]